MAATQLSGRNSLRDVVSNLTAQARKRYHLGIRSSLQMILRFLQLKLFERRDLLELLRGDPPELAFHPIKLLWYSHESLWDSSVVL